jgi:hypothetical protein
VSGEDHPFALPDIPSYLNELLACEDFHGGIEPRIGRKHMRVITIDGFPKMSSPGVLRETGQPAHRVPLEHSCGAYGSFDTTNLMLGANASAGRSWLGHGRNI